MSYWITSTGSYSDSASLLCFWIAETQRPSWTWSHQFRSSYIRNPECKLFSSLGSQDGGERKCKNRYYISCGHRGKCLGSEKDVCRKISGPGTLSREWSLRKLEGSDEEKVWWDFVAAGEKDERWCFGCGGVRWELENSISILSRRRGESGSLRNVTEGSINQIRREAMSPDKGGHFRNPEMEGLHLRANVVKSETKARHPCKTQGRKKCNLGICKSQCIYSE